MNHHVKTLLSLLLALLLCLPLLPAASADGERSYTLAAPNSVAIDFTDDYTAFDVSLSSLSGIDPAVGQHLTLSLSPVTYLANELDSSKKIRWEIYTVEDFGTDTERLTGTGTSAEVIFQTGSEAYKLAAKIPDGDYDEGTYTGSIRVQSEFWLGDYNAAVGETVNIPVSVTIPERYDVAIQPSAHGTVTAQDTHPYAGKTVKLTATPSSEYYRLGSLTVTCGSTPVECTQSETDENEFTFVMPEGDVTVTAIFISTNIHEIFLFERVWDGQETWGTFSEDEEHPDLYHYDYHIENDRFEEDVVRPFLQLDVQVYINGTQYAENGPAPKTTNYYYLFDSVDALPLKEGSGYSASSRQMILVASHPGTYRFTLNTDDKTLTVTHTYDDPNAEPYVYAMGFDWTDEIPYPFGDAQEAANQGEVYGWGDPLAQDDLYLFEDEQTVWMSSEVYGGNTIAWFYIARDGVIYSDKDTLIHNVPAEGQLLDLRVENGSCRLIPDFDEYYEGLYDFFYGVTSHKLVVKRRSVTLIYDAGGYIEVGGNEHVPLLRESEDNGITIDREGTIFSGDEVTITAPKYRDGGKLQFNGWYRIEDDNFSWDTETGEPWGDCVSSDNVYTFAPFGDTELFAAYTETPFDDGYYLIGPDWTVDAIDPSRHFEENPEAEGEYMLSAPLTEGEEIKTVEIENGEIKIWYPDGLGNQYTVDAAHAGNARIYFRTDYNSDWSAFGGYIYIVGEYSITCAKPENGRLNTETRLAAAGDEVTLSVEPYSCYMLDTLTVLCGETEVETTYIDDRTYSFIMPAGDVTVTATFKGEPYVVSFVPEYGNDETAFTQNAAYGALLTEPSPAPTREGYVFGGWYEPNWNLNWWYDEEAGYRLEEYTLAELLADWEGCDADRFMRAWDFENDLINSDVTLYAKWTVAEAVPEFKTQALALEGKIGLIFFMDLSCLSDDEKAASYMTFAITGSDPISDEPVAFDANNTNGDGTYYGFTCYVASIQMAETITATFHYGDGQTVTKDYSIKQYIKTFEEYENMFDDETVALVHALADYGHHVQAFLADQKGWDLGESGDYAEMDTFYSEYYDGYDNIIHEFEEFHKEIHRDFQDENIVKAPYTVVLDSDTAIRVYFTPAAGFNGNVSAVLDGNTGDETALERGSDGRYMVEIANIPAHLLGETHTIVVYTGDNCFGQGSSVYTCVYVSVMSYVYSILTSGAYADNTLAKNAVLSMYAYWDAAVAYRYAHPEN